jgi:hypothetical protein
MTLVVVPVKNPGFRRAVARSYKWVGRRWLTRANSDLMESQGIPKSVDF